jgi:hypothetical protein
MLPIFSFGQSVDTESRLLAECEFSYAYAAQIMQLKNNEGSAKNLLMRSTLMTATNFFRNSNGQFVPESKLNELKSVRPNLKMKYDQNPELAFRYAQKCDQSTDQLVAKEMNSGKKLFGNSFHTLHNELFRRMRSKIGLD